MRSDRFPTSYRTRFLGKSVFLLHRDAPVVLAEHLVTDARNLFEVVRLLEGAMRLAPGDDFLGSDANAPPVAPAPHTNAATATNHLNVVIRASSGKCVLLPAIRLQEAWADNAHNSRQRCVSTRSQAG